MLVEHMEATHRSLAVRSRRKHIRASCIHETSRHMRMFCPSSRHCLSQDPSFPMVPDRFSSHSIRIRSLMIFGYSYRPFICVLIVIDHMQNHFTPNALLPVKICRTGDKFRPCIRGFFICHVKFVTAVLHCAIHVDFASFQIYCDLILRSAGSYLMNTKLLANAFGEQS